MEQNSRESTDQAEAGKHVEECGEYTLIEKNGLVQMRECDGCGTRLIQTRPRTDVLVMILGIIATGAFFTSGGILASPELSAEVITMWNTVFGTSTGLATVWFGSNVSGGIEINAGDSHRAQ